MPRASPFRPAAKFTSPLHAPHLQKDIVYAAADGYHAMPSQRAEISISPAATAWHASMLALFGLMRLTFYIQSDTTY